MSHLGRGVLAGVVLGIGAARAAAQDPSDAVYSESRVNTFRFTISAADWNAICNDGAASGDIWKRADMTWEGPSGTETVPGVGVKRSGAGTAGLDTPKPSLRLSFNEFEFANPAGPGTPGRKWRGVNRIKLDSMIGNTDPAMMRDRVAYGIMRAMGSPAPRACHARVYVNGALKGLFIVEEPPRKDYVRYRWNEEDGNLYEVGGNVAVDSLDNDQYLWRGPDPAPYMPRYFDPQTNFPGGDHRDIVNLVNVLNNFPVGEIRTRLEGQINLNGLLLYLASTTVFADADDIPHWGGHRTKNHFWYHRAGTNRMEIIKWDPGASQGLYDSDSGFAKGQSPLAHQYDKTKLARWIRNDAAAWEAYKTKIRQILDGPVAGIQGRIDSIYNQIRSDAYADPLKGASAGDPGGFTNAEFDAGVSWLKDWYVRRVTYLRSQVGSGGATNGAQFVSQSVPSSMTPGQTVSVSVTMRNTGTSTWTEAGYRLGSQNPQDNVTWGMNRVSMTGSVAPGQQKTFTWSVTAPTAAGTYNFQWRMRQSGVEWFGDLTLNVAVQVGGGGGAVTRSFQDGVSPTASYAGTRDTYLSQNAPTTNFGTSTDLRVDGDDPAGTGKDLSALLKWDVTAIPAGSTVQSARITFTVTNPSAQTYELYRLGRAWSESQATWNQAASGTPWQAAGAQGSGDRGGTVRGTVTASATGAVTITLNSAGVALVQSWVDSPSSNLGLILSDTANTDGLAVASREAATASQRPRLQVTYAASAVAAAAEEASPEASAPLSEDDAITAAAEEDASVHADSSGACGALGIESMLLLALLGWVRRARGGKA